MATAIKTLLVIKVWYEDVINNKHELNKIVSDWLNKYKNLGIFPVISEISGDTGTTCGKKTGNDWSKNAGTQ